MSGVGGKSSMQVTIRGLKNMITVLELFFSLFPQSITCISFPKNNVETLSEDQVVIIHCVQDTSSLTLNNITLSIAFMFMYVIKLTLKIFKVLFLFRCFSFHSAKFYFGNFCFGLFIQQKKKKSN